MVSNQSTTIHGQDVSLATLPPMRPISEPPRHRITGVRPLQRTPHIELDSDNASTVSVGEEPPTPTTARRRTLTEGHLSERMGREERESLDTEQLLKEVKDKLPAFFEAEQDHLKLYNYDELQTTLYMIGDGKSNPKRLDMLLKHAKDWHEYKPRKKRATYIVLTHFKNVKLLSSHRQQWNNLSEKEAVQLCLNYLEQGRRQLAPKDKETLNEAYSYVIPESFYSNAPTAELTSTFFAADRDMTIEQAEGDLRETKALYKDSNKKLKDDVKTAQDDVKKANDALEKLKKIYEHSKKEADKALKSATDALDKRKEDYVKSQMAYGEVVNVAEDDVETARLALEHTCKSHSNIHNMDEDTIRVAQEEIYAARSILEEKRNKYLKVQKFYEKRLIDANTNISVAKNELESTKKSTQEALITHENAIIKAEETVTKAEEHYENCKTYQVGTVKNEKKAIQKAQANVRAAKERLKVEKRMERQKARSEKEAEKKAEEEKEKAEDLKSEHETRKKSVNKAAKFVKDKVENSNGAPVEYSQKESNFIAKTFLSLSPFYQSSLIVNLKQKTNVCEDYVHALHEHFAKQIKDDFNNGNIKHCSKHIDNMNLLIELLDSDAVKRKGVTIQHSSSAAILQDLVESKYNSEIRDAIERPDAEGYEQEAIKALVKLEIKDIEYLVDAAYTLSEKCANPKDKNTKKYCNGLENFRYLLDSCDDNQRAQMSPIDTQKIEKIKTVFEKAYKKYEDKRQDIEIAYLPPSTHMEGLFETQGNLLGQKRQEKILRGVNLLNSDMEEQQKETDDMVRALLYLNKKEQKHTLQRIGQKAGSEAYMKFIIAIKNTIEKNINGDNNALNLENMSDFKEIIRKTDFLYTRLKREAPGSIKGKVYDTLGFPIDPIMKKLAKKYAPQGQDELKMEHLLSLKDKDVRHVIDIFKSLKHHVKRNNVITGIDNLKNRSKEYLKQLDTLSTQAEGNEEKLSKIETLRNKIKEAFPDHLSHNQLQNLAITVDLAKLDAATYERDLVDEKLGNRITKDSRNMMMNAFLSGIEESIDADNPIAAAFKCATTCLGFKAIDLIHGALLKTMQDQWQDGSGTAIFEEMGSDALTAIGASIVGVAIHFIKNKLAEDERFRDIEDIEDIEVENDSLFKSEYLGNLASFAVANGITGATFHFLGAVEAAWKSDGDDIWENILTESMTAGVVRGAMVASGELAHGTAYYFNHSPIGDGLAHITRPIGHKIHDISGYIAHHIPGGQAVNGAMSSVAHNLPNWVMHNPIAALQSGMVNLGSHAAHATTFGGAVAWGGASALAATGGAAVGMAGTMAATHYIGKPIAHNVHKAYKHILRSLQNRNQEEEDLLTPEESVADNSSMSSSYIGQYFRPRSDSLISNDSDYLSATSEIPSEQNYNHEETI